MTIRTYTRNHLKSRLAGVLLSTLLLASAGTSLAQTEHPDGTAVATFAGGCFWCMEPPYDELDGVISTTSGFTDGKTRNPSYKQVTTGKTGHTEAVQIVYDPTKVSFEKLVEVFWRNIDPTDINGQFCDRGSPYRPALFYHDEKQREIAERSLAELEMNKPFKEAIVVPIVAASAFYDAEDYHQDYYLKNPIRYKFYRSSCRRDQRLEQLWGTP